MIARILFVVVAVALLPSGASARVRHSERVPLLETRSNLERSLTWVKIGTAGAIGVLAVGGIAAYKTAHMCDAYPDPADDCAIGKGLATAGTVFLVGIGAAMTVVGAVSWVSVELELDAVNARLRPTLVPVPGGGVAGIHVSF